MSLFPGPGGSVQDSGANTVSQLSGPGDSVQDSGANIVFPTIWTGRLFARLGRQHCFSNYLDRAALCKTWAPTLFFQLPGFSDSGPLALHVVHLIADLGVRQAFFGVEVVRPDSHHWVEAARVDNRLDQDHGERRGARLQATRGVSTLHARKLLGIHR